MELIQISIIACSLPSFFLVLPLLYYYRRLMRLIKVRRRKLIVSGGLTVFAGYLFLISSFFLGNKIFLFPAYLLFLLGFIIVGYVFARIYLDLKKVVG